jgi:ABC-type branched-subunit amino acid transport system ATPase component
MTSVEPTGPLLEAKGITVKFGGLTALNAVDLSVPEGKLIGLLGPNGAGKSTMFNVCSGFQRATTGKVFLAGQEITNATPQGRARMGLARTFQQPEVFFGLTVREHFVLSYRVRHERSRLWKDLFTPSSLKKVSTAETDRVQYLVELLKVEDIADSLVDTLPLGSVRLVEIGRALATEPRVILLDEPLSGLDSHEAARLAAALKRTVEEDGTSLLLVEHDAPLVLGLCSEIFVLDFGQLIAQGPPELIRNNEAVKTAYLGDAQLDKSTAVVGTEIA